MGKSGKQLGEEHVEALRRYLASLRDGEERLPRLPDGRPNLSAIARSCGFTRQVWTNNAAALDLLTVHAAQEGTAAEVQAGPADGRTRVAKARVAKLENALHDTQERLEAKTAECEALREELDARRLGEDHLVNTGRSIRP